MTPLAKGCTCRESSILRFEAFRRNSSHTKTIIFPSQRQYTYARIGFGIRAVRKKARMQVSSHLRYSILTCKKSLVRSGTSFDTRSESDSVMVTIVHKRRSVCQILRASLRTPQAFSYCRKTLLPPQYCHLRNPPPLTNVDLRVYLLV